MYSLVGALGSGLFGGEVNRRSPPELGIGLLLLDPRGLEAAVKVCKLLE